jgi:hypothetical protein
VGYTISNLRNKEHTNENAHQYSYVLCPLAYDMQGIMGRFRL